MNSEWELTIDQLFFMVRHHDEITDAYERDDTAALRALADSDAFKQVFWGVSWDEAWDRYEETLP